MYTCAYVHPDTYTYTHTIRFLQFKGLTGNVAVIDRRVAYLVCLDVIL